MKRPLLILSVALCLSVGVYVFFVGLKRQGENKRNVSNLDTILVESGTKDALLRRDTVLGKVNRRIVPDTDTNTVAPFKSSSDYFDSGIQQNGSLNGSGEINKFESLQQETFLRGRRVSANRKYAITSPNREDETLFRCEVREGDYASNGSRAEVKLTPFFGNHYEFEFRLVKYEFQGQWFSIADWHQQPVVSRKRMAEGKDAVPPLSVRLVGDQIVLYNKAQSENTGETVRMFSAPISENWNSVSIKITWSDNNNGSLDITLNGKQKFVKGIATTYDTVNPVFFKVGIYRNGNYKGRSVIEFRNVKVDGRIIVPDYGRSTLGGENIDRINRN